ncbi:MAG: protein-L-isoaspartate O-methyltransferase family protein [Hyphomicrobiales bacterium]
MEQMTDFNIARANMVESQVRPNGITDRRIIAAMAAIPRENFVPAARRDIAYVDDDLEIASDRYLMEPMVFARLVQLAAIKPGDKVLHVGAGTGYGTAVLARMAARVVALESDATLAAMARNNLVGVSGSGVAEGPLAEGRKAEVPFDVIVIEGRVPEVPEALFAQLADGGRLVAVVGEGEAANACIWTVKGKARGLRAAFDAAGPPLPGFAKKQPAFVF